jgi:hypothetical protein
MSESLPAEHYVLLGPKGKQAGRSGQKSLAQRLAALEMTANGHGRGLPSLLIPKTDRDIQSLFSLVSKGYWYRIVKSRATIRKPMRLAARNHELLRSLTFIFLREHGSKKRVTSALVEKLAEWICESLRCGDPEVTRLVSKAHHDLLNRTSKDWWKKQINQGLKKIKK